jgi:type IV pilus assembly protein PilY1
VDVNGDGTIDMDGDRAIIYAGLRRGGRGYYAIDVSNPYAPEAPVAHRRRRNAGLRAPRAGFLAAPGGPDRPERRRRRRAGGDFRRRLRPAVRQRDGRDQRSGWSGFIYVVNGADRRAGVPIQHPQMLDSIPSTVAAVDTAGDGLLDRIVVGDLGGRDLAGRHDAGRARRPTTGRCRCWPTSGATRPATAPGGQHDRRFHNQPDVVQSKETFLIGDAEAVTVKYDAVLIGTRRPREPALQRAEQLVLHDPRPEYGHPVGGRRTPIVPHGGPDRRHLP